MAVAAPLENNLTRRIAMVLSLVWLPLLAPAAMHVVVVEGLAGDEVYAEQFEQQVAAIGAAANSITEDNRVHLLRGDNAARDHILEQLDAMKANMHADDWFALFLIGHGSFDDYEYKFNIPGPDLTGEDISAALDDLPVTNQLFVNTSSASGAIADLVKKDNRIVVLATRSGTERHATRFGVHFAGALSDVSADTDKNSMISVEEAFRFAERQVNDFFERNNQLATEHAELDGGDAGRLTLARIGPTQPAVMDAALAELIADRDELNAAIEALRLARDEMPMADYQSALLERMLELARVEDAIEAQQEELDANQ
jgi:hypothetical protein